MNAKRIILGGAFAGALIAGGETLLSNWLVTLDRTGSFAEIDSATPFGIFLLRNFSLGVCCILMYALIRPRFGAGAMTAIASGLLAFLFGVLFPSFGDAMNGGFPPALMLVSIIWAAIELPLASLAGAFVYREDSEPSLVSRTV